MSVDVRYLVERIALTLMAVSGVVVLIADLFGRLDETLRTQVARLDTSFQAQLAKLDIRYGVSEPFPPVLGDENQVNVQVADNMTHGSDIGMRIPARRH
ncbi:hypothetical protein [Streptomyces sp. NBC_01264]|uniref:hypothetical protein n=1 Tax=Streptomyces sp. NBC_01264 TaxID=2903804 RepID=UPI00225142B4|nr:hypothetical protein [Streptomyces sp. NBC_01264]MCX4779187.1 hypothetical protein [Streptomyces sp. NBC_01264]